MRNRLRRLLRGAMPWIDRRIEGRYFGLQDKPKLHIGCGTNVLNGWLNTDLRPISNSVMYLDATRPLPFADSSFDYIFSEHMIEHISYPEAEVLLRECHRVLKDKGKLRLATPDLAFLVELYRRDKSPLQLAYIAWSAANVKGIPRGEDSLVINNFFRAWGHQVIYDEKLMRQMMLAAGFDEPVRCSLGDSDDPALRGLENERRMPQGFLKLETMVLEAEKRL